MPREADIHARKLHNDSDERLLSTGWWVVVVPLTIRRLVDANRNRMIRIVQGHHLGISQKQIAPSIGDLLEMVKDYSLWLTGRESRCDSVIKKGQPYWLPHSLTQRPCYRDCSSEA